MRTVWLVLQREVRTRAASRPFLISTAISAAVLIAIVVAIGATAGDTTITYHLGVVGTRPAAVAGAAQDLASGDESLQLDVRKLADRPEAERLVEAGGLDAALVGNDLVVKTEPDPRLGTLLQAAHRAVALPEANVALPPPLAIAALEPDDRSEDRGTVAFIGVVLLYAQILGFGYWVASGIVEEKSSRVVELLLAKARSSHLLAGKLVGIGALGLAQLATLLAAGLGTALVLGQVELPPGTYGLAAAVGGWFVLGYALYSCLFAVAGAIASRPEELQGTTMPLSLLTMTGFFAAIFAQEDPTGAVARAATFFPPSAPLVMPIRQAAGELPLWEATLGIALILATIAIAVPLVGRIYAGGALFTRGRLKLRDAYARASE